MDKSGTWHCRANPRGIRYLSPRQDLATPAFILERLAWNPTWLSSIPSPSPRPPLNLSLARHPPRRLNRPLDRLLGRLSHVSQHPFSPNPPWQKKLTALYSPSNLLASSLPPSTSGCRHSNANVMNRSVASPLGPCDT